MKKKLFRMFLFGLMLFIASKVFIAFTAFQVLTEIKEQYKNEFLLTYKWISSSLDGDISIEGIELTPYVMKKTFNIKEITFQYVDYYSLVTNLPSLQKGSLNKLKHLSIPSIQTELKGKSFKDLLALEIDTSWFSPFSLYGCDSIHQLSSDDYQRMGLDKWESSLKVEVEQNSQLNDVLTMSFDQNELGRINVVTEWPEWSIETFLKQKSIQDLKLMSLKVNHQDAGFFRRLNILCNNKDVEKRSIFSANAAMGWKNAMYSQGLLVSDNLVELYGTYLMQGGSLSVDAKREGGFLLTNIVDLVNKDVIKYFDIELKLNGQAISRSELYVDGSIIFPPLKKDVIEDLSASKEIKFKPGYKLIEIDFVNQHLNRKIRVNMLDGKEYEGVLGSVTEYNLELTQKLAGGVVNYPLMLDEIQTFEAWINQEQ
mgnify:CR=1 FL=1|tara:strand:- start:9554 stop:10834 length:1281 start_codon:yes stop_codon:yes gene_type:complete